MSLLTEQPGHWVIPPACSALAAQQHRQEGAEEEIQIRKSHFMELSW